MKSSLYRGFVIHRRREPAKNAFKFNTYFLFLDLDEVDSVFRRRWFWSSKKFNFAWFRPADHMNHRHPQSSETLKESVLSVVADCGIDRPIGSVRVLTQLRYLGFVMNPVSFFYCYAPDGETLEAIVTEVNNTPWGEQHLYLIDAKKNQTKPILRKLSDPESKPRIVANEIDKVFHVSPFMEMDMTYVMSFSQPGQTLDVHMGNHQSGKRLLNIVMKLKRAPITGSSLAWSLVRYPMISIQVFAGIYWQALKLYFKNVPFVPHPMKSPANDKKSSGLSPGQYFRDEPATGQANRPAVENQSQASQKRTTLS